MKFQYGTTEVCKLLFKPWVFKLEEGGGFLLIQHEKSKVSEESNKLLLFRIEISLKTSTYFVLPESTSMLHE